MLSDADETVHLQSDTESDKDGDSNAYVAEEIQESKTGKYITHYHLFP